MSELTFTVDQTALDTVKNTKLSTNFDDMKLALAEFVEPYKHLIVSEDAIASAKSDRAKINSIANHIDTYRKSVKAIYTEPLKAFENQCKELVAICNEGKANIDEQVKSYEEKRKEEKLFLLKEYFDNAEKKYPDYCIWEQAVNPKWGNVTYPLQQCHMEIDTYIMKVDKEVGSILALRSEWEFSLLDQYRQTHDILDVLALHERLTATKQKEEQRRKELMPIEITDPDFAELPFGEDQHEPESTYKVTFNAWCTYPQVDAIRNALKSLGIYSEIVDTVEINVPYHGE